jgi:hypothetical protein
MTIHQPPTEMLASYGKFQPASVRRATFGRRLAGTDDALPGFERSPKGVMRCTRSGGC